MRKALVRGTAFEPLRKPYTPPRNTYKKLIVTTGFGHSGSRTIIDLLSEFDNTSVIGYHDIGGGSPLSKDKGSSKMEVDFVRGYGGVFDLESAFSCYSTLSSIKLLEFIHFSEYNYKNSGVIYNDEYMRLTREFIDNLVLCRIPLSYPMAIIGTNAAFEQRLSLEKDYSNLESPLIYNEHKHKRYTYKLKQLGVSEYRKYANEYIHKVLNTIESKENLVLDQFIAGFSFDFERDKEYLNDFKQIAVWRDPRDIYVTGILLNESWMPKSAEDFVLWYNKENINSYREAKNDFMLTLRFEDIVLNYSETIPKILDFLEIDKSHHIYPQTQFRPEISKQNIGLWKNYGDQKAIRYIEEHLKNYLWEK